MELTPPSLNLSEKDLYNLRTYKVSHESHDNLHLILLCSYVNNSKTKFLSFESQLSKISHMIQETNDRIKYQCDRISLMKIDRACWGKVSKCG